MKDKAQGSRPAKLPLLGVLSLRNGMDLAGLKLQCTDGSPKIEFADYAWGIITPQEDECGIVLQVELTAFGGVTSGLNIFKLRRPA